MSGIAYHVWLPFPPSVNNLFDDLSPAVRAKIEAGMRRRGKRGRAPTRATSKRYRTWQKEAFPRIQIARLPRFTGPVAAKITLTPPDMRTRDIDNYNKAILDALVKCGVLKDDSQVHPIHVDWEYDNEPGAIVELAEVGTERQPLTATERRTLAEMRKSSERPIAPTGRKNKVTRALIKKGYVQEEPGLFE